MLSGKARPVSLCDLKSSDRWPVTSDQIEFGKPMTDRGSLIAQGDVVQ